MSKYIITGGNPLKGTIKISGNKNSVLPCMAACLLTSEQVILRNVPQINDVEVMTELLRELGSEVEKEGDVLKIRTPEIKSTTPSSELLTKLRASVLLVGPLLARAGEVTLSHPGGDVIGKRSIDVHIEGLKQLGFEFVTSDLTNQAKKTGEQPTPRQIFLEEPSVTATENLLIAASLYPATVTLKNCAQEPHVVDLCKLLTLMGVQIKGIGNSTLEITGKQSLNGADFTISGDYMELGTYAIAAAITKGEVEIAGVEGFDLEPITYHLSKMGVEFEKKDGMVIAKAQELKAVPHLKVNIWPGFPTDLMSLAIVLATQCQGVTLCHDWMYESRMFFVDKLVAMGANITIADPHRVLVSGPSKLYARNQDSPDIRAGMALVLAALVAQGTSTINRAELIERGYGKVVENLTSLGANIQAQN